MELIEHKRDAQFWLYIFYLITLLIGQNYLLMGRFSISFFYTILMSLNIFLQGRYNYKTFAGRKEMNIYFAFVFVFLLCSLVNGDFARGQSQTISLLVKYWECFLVFFYTNLYVRTAQNAKVVFNVLLIVISFNAVVNILQAMGNYWGFTIFNSLNNRVLKDSIADLAEGIIEYEQGYSSLLPGIYASPVLNGYFLATLGCLSLYYVYSNCGKTPKIFGVLSLICISIALFLVQQRSAFYLFLIAFFAISCLPKNRLIIISVLTISIAYIIANVALEDALGRLFNLQDESREMIYSSATKYIGENLLFGGRLEFVDKVGKSSHNLIYNGLLYSGLFGCIIIVMLLFKMLKTIGYIYIISYKHKSVNHAIILGIGCAVYILIGFTHNNSLVTGDSIIWLLYVLLCILIKNPQFANTK